VGFEKMVRVISGILKDGFGWDLKRWLGLLVEFGKMVIGGI
jgi:hypothetical protein